ncbi:Dynein light chain 4, axonemal [Clonorchis sinensis]|uniref:Dynein light chain 4, axonemal n=2 Tax=Clonorchis sinensis TaxID=79923 RepID=A0A8T1N2J4_CLOSI|nr:Dynein light chain 4, axonemal [Clonorchis sinensis]GAA54039.1 dynein light chain 4 axonemal [Clonorchis sinensis]
MEEEKEVKEDVVKNAFTYPLVRYSEMNEELQAEVVELCVTACEKWHSDNEMAARMIKEALDQKASAGWHVVIGEGYGFEVTHDVRSLLFMYFNGSLAILIWKCS